MYSHAMGRPLRLFPCNGSPEETLFIVDLLGDRKASCGVQTVSRRECSGVAN